MWKLHLLDLLSMIGIRLGHGDIVDVHVQTNPLIYRLLILVEICSCQFSGIVVDVLDEEHASEAV